MQTKVNRDLSVQRWMYEEGLFTVSELLKKFKGLFKDQSTAKAFNDHMIQKGITKPCGVDPDYEGVNRAHYAPSLYKCTVKPSNHDYNYMEGISITDTKQLEYFDDELLVYKNKEPVCVLVPLDKYKELMKAQGV